MKRLKLRLPATSANLGPGFDALGLAFSLWLEIEAEESQEFSLRAAGTGRGAGGVARAEPDGGDLPGACSRRGRRSR